MAANAAALRRIGKPLHFILTQQFNIADADYIATWYWQLCCASSVETRPMKHAEDLLVYFEVVELCIVNLLTSKCVNHLSFSVVVEFATDR
jgi:hypothetical protein